MDKEENGQGNGTFSHQDEAKSKDDETETQLAPIQQKQENQENNNSSQYKQSHEYQAESNNSDDADVDSHCNEQGSKPSNITTCDAKNNTDSNNPAEDVAAQMNNTEHQQSFQRDSSQNTTSHQDNDAAPNNEETDTPLPQSQQRQSNTDNKIQAESNNSGATALNTKTEQGNGCSSTNNGSDQENQAEVNNSADTDVDPYHDEHKHKTSNITASHPKMNTDSNTTAQAHVSELDPVESDQRDNTPKITNQNQGHQADSQISDVAAKNITERPDTTSHQDNDAALINKETDTQLPQSQQRQSNTVNKIQAESNHSEILKQNLTNYWKIKCGETKNAEEEFVNRLTRLTKVNKVKTVNDCHFVLIFCAVVSRAGTDINAALTNLSKIPESKWVVLVVLHHTFDAECVVPENTFCKRKNMISVNCLFHEDQGLLQCSKNDESLRRVKNFINPRESHPSNSSNTGNFKRNDKPSQESHVEDGFIKKIQCSQRSLLGEKLNYYILLSGNTLKSHETFINHLKKRISGLQEVSPGTCDFILVFCPVTSQHENNVKAALQMLNEISDTTPAVLVVLHHTFDSDCVVPDSSRTVSRENMIAVDCLFHEDSGFLKCSKNSEALEKATQYIKNMKSIMTRNQALPNKPKACSSPDEEMNEIYKIAIEEKEENIKQLKEKIQKLNSPELQHSTEVNFATKLTVIILDWTKTEGNKVKSILLDKAESIPASCSSQHIEVTQTELTKRKITIVEPDLFDSELLKDKLGVHLRPAGPCAYLLVLSVSTDFKTENLQKLITKMEEIWGEKCWRKTMILFTTTEENVIKNPDEYVKSANLEIQNVVKKCENRYYCLNVTNVDANQQSELLQKIENAVEGNRNASQVYQIITEMEKKREAERHEIWKTLQTLKQLQNDYKKDVLELKNRKEQANCAFIQTLVTECEIKIDFVEKIKHTYDKLAGIEDDRQFIKAILPENQIIWLSVINEQDRKLDELYEQFLSVVKHKDKGHQKI